MHAATLQDKGFSNYSYISIHSHIHHYITPSLKKTCPHVSPVSEKQNLHNDEVGVFLWVGSAGLLVELFGGGFLCRVVQEEVHHQVQLVQYH